MPIAKKLREVDGFYGSQHTACTLWVADMSDGTMWYMVEESDVAYQTTEDIEDGVDIETINDIDLFNVMNGVRDIEHFEELVEE